VAHGAVRPGRRDLRYDAVTGGENQRAIYYLVRRKLGYGPADWDALPWHHQRMFLDGLTKELEDPENPSEPTGPETDGMANEDAFDKALMGAKRRRAERGD
jgi:hypothetical protein